MDKLEKHIKSYPTVTQVSKQIPRSGKRSVTYDIIPSDYGKLRQDYSSIIAGSEVSLQDPQILDVLIENRDRLRNRFMGEVVVYSDQGAVCTLYLYGCLIEHMSHVRDFIVEGMHISSPAHKLPLIFNNLIDRFKQEFNLTDGNYTEPTTNNPFTVSRITISVSFA